MLAWNYVAFRIPRAHICIGNIIYDYYNILWGFGSTRTSPVPSEIIDLPLF